MSVNTSAEPANDRAARDDSNWAKPVGRLEVSEVPAGAVNLNVQGRRVVGPVQGFGQLWQKTYRVGLVGADVSPTELIKIWKKEFASFWPRGSRFYAPLISIEPGEVALLDVALAGGLRLSTGVYVIYADEEAFTFMCPEGHTFSGWITFSAFEEDGVTVAQIQVLMRPNDPFYEVTMPIVGHRMEHRFWAATLRALAARFGVDQPVGTRSTCIDPRRQWSRAGNIWQNAAIRTMLYHMAVPLRWAIGLRHRGPKTGPSEQP
jgi:hypothetical protein